MTNFQQGARRLEREHLQRLWLGVPIAAGALLALLLTLVALVPLWSGVRRDDRRLQDLKAMREQVPLLRRQLAVLDATEEKVSAQQARLFELVTGSGDLSTFVSALDQEARAAGVQLQLYEPQAAPETPEEEPGERRPQGRQPGAGAGEGEAGKPAAPAEPGAGLLEVKGLQRRSVLVSAQGSFPALLRFLRGVEERNLLVVQSDLQLMLQEAKQRQENAPRRPDPVELKLLMSLYEKSLTATPEVTPPEPSPRG